MADNTNRSELTHQPTTMRRRFAAAWLEADPRALGLFRIFFGILCMYDVIRRYGWIETFYSNTGTLSNHFNLYSPLFRDNISLLSGFSTPMEVKVFFWISLICLFFFTIGFKTKIFQILSWLCILSIHSRNTLLANGGDVVMNIWWIWTIWLPLGARLSVDSLRKSLATGPDSNPGLLQKSIGSDASPIRSLAIFMVLWQLSIIYFFNTVHKGGHTWSNGTSIAYCLEQDRIVTWLGLWARESWPLWISQVLTWGTLVIEGVAPLLLLTPFAVVWARRAAILSLIGLHGGIWALTNVGLFSPVMMVSYLLLLTRADIELGARILKKFSGPQIQVWYDDTCGVCFRLARIGARLDRFERIEWFGSEAAEARPSHLTEEQFESVRANFILSEVSGHPKVYLGHEAIAHIIRALPLGWCVSWIFFVPGISWILARLYTTFAKRRRVFSQWLGYGVCGLNVPQVSQERASQSQIGYRVKNAAATLGILFFFAATTSQMLHENKFMRVQVFKNLDIKYRQPAFLKAVVSYARIFQGWSMFAPNAPMTDGWLVIDVERPDGSHIDPQTGRQPDFSSADARKMEWDQFWGSYSMRIAAGRHKRYRKELVDWLRNSRIQRLKLPAGERVKAVTVWWIGDRSPNPMKPNEEPKVTEKYIVAQWPEKSKAKK